MPKSKTRNDYYEQHEAVVAVSKTVLGKFSQEIKRIKIRPFVTNPAHVSCKFGTTIPAGDYRSIKVDVMISCPCYKEEIVDVYLQVRDLADRLIEKEVERINPEEETDEIE